jgi:hypothetical protein
MILSISPESPGWVHAAAAAILTAHISAGGVGLASGAAALALRKGSRAHGAAGTVFFVSTLTMSGIGACVAPFLPQRISAVAGVITFYLVATAWATVRRAAGSVGRFEIVALVVALAAAGADLTFAIQGTSRPDGLIDHLPSQPGFVFGALALMAAGFDLKVLLRRGVSGVDRIARHLWRMCAALFIAAASLFLGQPKVFPASLRDSPLLFVPEIAVLGLMVFWLIRIRSAGALQSAPSRVGLITPPVVGI